MNAPFVPSGQSDVAICNECADPLEYGGNEQYRCVVDGCGRAGLVVDENGNTPKEAESWEPPTPFHWTDLWPKFATTRDIFAEND